MTAREMTPCSTASPTIAARASRAIEDAGERGPGDGKLEVGASERHGRGVGEERGEGGDDPGCREGERGEGGPPERGRDGEVGERPPRARVDELQPDGVQEPGEAGLVAAPHAAGGQLHAVEAADAGGLEPAEAEERVGEHDDAEHPDAEHGEQSEGSAEDGEERPEHGGADPGEREQVRDGSRQG